MVVTGCGDFCVDEKPWMTSDDDDDDDDSDFIDDDDDDDDDDEEDETLANTDYDRRREGSDDSDVFDYVRVQLPMGGRGDNIAKSQLTANQVPRSTLV